MEGDSLLGRSLTLSIMRRAKDSPIEPPKFLGHGNCDTFHYTAPIRDPSGSATADQTIIATQAWKLCQAHHSADTKDLRGIGISIQNLESEIDAAAQKQTKLSFAKQNYHSVQHSAHSEVLDVFAAGPQEPFIVVDGPQDKATTPSESETKHPNLTHGAKYIAKQLAPARSKTTSPTKYNIFNKRELAPVSISDAELRDLDIDPATFRAIPPDIQREQLTYQRMVHRNSRSTFGQSSRNHLALDDRDSRSRSRSASVVPRTSSSVSARFAAIPSLKKARTTDELQDLISKWVSSCAESGPEEAATDSFRDFLLKCIADDEAGDCGLEKVVAVMKWWLYLCRRRWGDSELLYVADVEEEPVDSASMWWAAFRSVKHALDKVVGQRFGGMLSLQ
jgi:DNA repair protein REV1